jgi:methyl-accepting chemotaxis protein PixJ
MLAHQPITDNPQPSQEKAPRKKLRENLRLNSLGSRLFLSVSGGALLGLGAMGFLFYQTFERQAESELRGLVAARVGIVNSELVPAKQSMDDISSAVKALQENDVKNLKAYKQLAFEFFLKRPKVAMAAGFGQTPYALAAEQKWFWPYFYLDQKSTEQKGERLSAPYNQFIYSELFKDDKYPTQDYYKTPAAGKSLFLEPYQYYGLTITTYTNPIYNSKGKLLAVTGMDINLKSIDDALKGNVLQNAGYYSILTEQGNLAAYSPNPKKVIDKKSYKDIPEFAAIWSQIQKGDRGLVRSGGNFLVYQRIPVNNWILLAAVPEKVVTAPVLLITAGSTLAVGLLLAGITFLFVQQLNKRLKPILDECNTLAATDAATQVEIQKLDEIGQLSTSFFNLLEKVKQNEGTIRQEAAMRLALEETQRQATESESMVLQADIERLLDTVSAVEEGNLTVQAPVSDRVTGLVSDTFNRLVEELATVMAQVLSAAQNVSSNTQTLEIITGKVASNASQQSESVSEALTLSGQVEESATATVQELQHSNQSLLSLIQTVKEGQSAINTLTQGTTTLQQGTDQIIQQMKTLGEFVGLAEQFVQDQNQIATQTQILALNASLVAARAAEQKDPRKFAAAAQEFAAIANQVSQLAQQTNEGLTSLEQRTSQIQNVVASVDAEVQGLGSLVSGFTQGVEQSNQAFNSVQTVTTNVVRTGEQVTQSSQDIIDRAQSTAFAMRAIVELAQKTADLTLDARQQSQSMGQLSDQLLKRVEFFRLPVSSENVPPIESSAIYELDRA